MAKNQIDIMHNQELIEVLKTRFASNPTRHPKVDWSTVVDKLSPKILDVLDKMESSGGEPDLMQLADGTLLYVDFCVESPAGRRSLCYDQQALEARKANKPVGAALESAQKMGAELMDEMTYRQLQAVQPVDLKTSSWIQTPDSIRKLGGALFCDRRFDTVFTYHNGAESYYGARGFRVVLRI